ncbi:sigma-70 family RNA polymerase sigma factor [Streptomyces sp. GQFP]|uniref:sigma-70 family RNA polymerase sigma factor n=1 Tax=Streptomyces sp. GQFP TaxID=2907545 RepID=UPI001F1B7AF7|nr:sigma-70 family RNA polymerase sigma factor [Streptomyces sp. GQFP]UIX31047.1 sigma-70 family RNA polymerase sigma factor [Streptomyces sp. GQFP]
MPDVRTQGSRGAHRYDGAPDTAAVFRRIAALPDSPERSVLRQEMVCAWTPMALRLARRFRHRGETFEDLRQVAQSGLVKAVCRFDPGHGTAFPDFAVPTILAEVKWHFRDDLRESLAPVPADALAVDREALRPLLRALPEGDRRILYMRFFCEMTQARIGLQLGVSQTHVSRLIARIRARLHDQVTADTHALRRPS